MPNIKTLQIYQKNKKSTEHNNKRSLAVSPVIVYVDGTQ